MAPDLLAGLNTDPPESSAMLTGAMLRETLGAGGKACRPLIAIHGLSSCYIEPALAYLAARGAPVRLGERLRGIEFNEERAVNADLGADRTVLAVDDAVVLAVPPWVAQELLPDLVVPNEFRAIVDAHFRVTPRPNQPMILGVIEWADRMAIRLSGSCFGDDQRRRSPSRQAARDACGRDLARSRDAERPRPGIAALADRQGKARDLRRDPYAGREETLRAHPVDKCRARGRLDANRSAGHHRRGGAFGL